MWWASFGIIMDILGLLLAKYKYILCSVGDGRPDYD